jgi:hypothetical protein
MNSGVHVYRINTTRLLVLPAIWLLFVAMLLGTLGRGTLPGEAAAGFVAAGILTLVLGPMFYLTVWRSRLELDAQGIAHHQFGYTVRSSWSNLERLSMEPGMEGLYLREPGHDSALLRGSTRFLQRLSTLTGMPSFIGDADALAQGRFIALMTFTSQLHGGPLSRDLERWAPQLFATQASR